MEIRKHQLSNHGGLAELFYHTVHIINAGNYTDEQPDTWATGKVDLDKWNQLFQDRMSIVVIDGDIITGFGDINKTGYFDRLYVHAGHQRKRIATATCNQLEESAQGKTCTHASIAARPFFEKRGYQVVKEQEVERQGTFLINFVMEKVK